MGLYAEQLSGTPFTFNKHKNQRSWLYKIVPTAKHGNWSECKGINGWESNFEGDDKIVSPEQLRWQPREDKTDGSFLRSVKTMMGAGSPGLKNGLNISTYSFVQKAQSRIAFYSADGDLLIVPQQGALRVTTEQGKLFIKPKEIVVIPRGVKHRIEGETEDAFYRGWMAEVYKGHFVIPDLGPIGANGCANERDFLAPSAAYEEDHSIPADE